jgi:endonuclease-3
MPEALEEKKRRASAIIRALEKEYPDAHVALDFTTPFELLIATILAAQCTDKLVNTVTPALFKKYPTPKHFVAASLPDIETYIKKVTFFRAKAKSVQECCRVLVEQHKSKVPQTLEELIALRGVGRKTANVVLGNAFGQEAIAVDTHVKRISNLLKLVNTEDPDKIEFELQKVLAKNRWTQWAHLIATHGRAVCIARRPKCAECVINQYCPSRLDLKSLK